MSVNILVVDDSAVMRRIIIRTLNLSGVPVGETYEAANGKEGLQLLKDHGIDLVLVDINMPVMNGEEMIRRIRGNPETVALPVVVVSTEGSETRIGALLRDKVGFVHKPFTPEQLGQIISQMTGVCDEQPDGEVSLPGSGLDF